MPTTPRRQREAETESEKSGSGAGRDSPGTPLLLELLRHGEAAPSDHGDAGRRLTSRGERAIQKLGERLAGQGWRPQRIFSSPYTRARETANLIAKAAKTTCEIEELDELTPDHEAHLVLGALVRRGVVHGHVVMVGHQPQMGNLAEFLTGSPQALAPGEMLRIECPNGPEQRKGTLIAAFRTGG